jgi:hypothetical protein
VVRFVLDLDRREPCCWAHVLGRQGVDDGWLGDVWMWWLVGFAIARFHLSASAPLCRVLDCVEFDLDSLPCLTSLTFRPDSPFFQFSFPILLVVAVKVWVGRKIEVVSCFVPCGAMKELALPGSSQFEFSSKPDDFGFDLACVWIGGWQPHSGDVATW